MTNKSISAAHPETSGKMFSGLIDYAGLFPPARLPMNDTVGNYGDYLGGANASTLARLICPVSRLDEMAGVVGHDGRFVEPLRLALIGSSGQDEPSLLKSVSADVEAMSRFTERHGSKFSFDIFEVRLSEDLASKAQPEFLAGFFGFAASTLHEADGSLQHLFFEGQFSKNWEAELEGLGRAVEIYGQFGFPVEVGLKMRCGSEDNLLVPPTDRLARLIVLASCSGFRYKLTAGLHHPISHDLGFGFLNVIAAEDLAGPLELTEPKIIEILEDQNASNFRIESNTIYWQDLSAPIDLSIPRGNFFSFGSCSFGEPIESLQSLGFLK